MYAILPHTLDVVPVTVVDTFSAILGSGVCSVSQKRAHWRSRGLDSSLELVFPEDRASSIPGSQALISVLVAVRSVAASADFGHDWSSRTAPQRGRLRLPCGVYKCPIQRRSRRRQQHLCLTCFSDGGAGSRDDASRLF